MALHRAHIAYAALINIFNSSLRLLLLFIIVLRER